MWGARKLLGAVMLRPDLACSWLVGEGPPTEIHHEILFLAGTIALPWRAERQGFSDLSTMCRVKSAKATHVEGTVATSAVHTMSLIRNDMYGLWCDLHIPRLNAWRRFGEKVNVIKVRGSQDVDSRFLKR